jgi:acyl-CoA thioester hydrolase
MNRNQFKFKSEVRVRNYEIDWQGIVHNATYLLYCETGRIAYLKNLGVKIDIGSIQKENKVVLVRNEIDYKSPATFDELLYIYTRVSYIRNTSFAFESMVEDSKSGRRIVENVAVHVWLDPKTDEPRPVSDKFRRLVEAFEGSNVAIERGSLA